MVNPLCLVDALRSDSNRNTNEHEDPWNWWNEFRSTADFSRKLSLALELSADIPSKLEIFRWQGENEIYSKIQSRIVKFKCFSGEPVGCLIIPSHLFIPNKQKGPVLSRAHETLILRFKEVINNVALIVKCNIEDDNLRCYSQYLKNLLAKNPNTDLMYG